MKKILSLLLILGTLLALCSCDFYGIEDETTTAAQTAPNIIIIPDTTAPATYTDEVETAEAVTSPETTQAAVAPTQNQNGRTQSDFEEESRKNLKTYYTDDSNNKYIVTVSDKFGVDRGNLVAFVRANSATPGATVLQFKGNRDANGNLITTADELVYVYDVLDNGDVKKTNKDGTDTYGYNQIAGRAAYTLVENYIIPNIEKYKRENRLDG